MHKPTRFAHDPTRPSHARPRRGLLAGAVLLAAALAISVLPASAAPDAVSGTAYGGGWIARHVGEDGSVPGFGGEPDVGATVQAALGLAAAEVGDAAFDRARAYVEANYQGYVTDEEGRDRPGALAFVILLADAAGDDPRAFGGSDPDNDLVARLRDTRQDSGPDAGLYGTQNPSFDGVFRQSLALLALDAAGTDPDPNALDWLVAQQCPDGGFPAYRDPAQRTADTCDPQLSAPDTNSTALAWQAALAVGFDLDRDPREYLATVQNDDGGFAFNAEFDTDTNSTALVTQALVAAGDDPAAGIDGRWTQPDLDNPMRALLLLQLGCSAEPGDRGAFAFQPDEDGSLSANAFATYQAVWGTARLAFPFGVRQPDAVRPAPECPDLAVARHAGPARVETAATIARRTWRQGAETVLVAYAYNYADALAGAPLAAALDAPVLLSEQDRLPRSVADTIAQLGARRAILLGGPSVLSGQVRRDLEAVAGIEEVERLAGTNRFATAARVAARLGPDEVYVTEGADEDPGRGWPDALAVAPLAGVQQRPILLVTTDELPPETRDALRGSQSVTIVGGPGAVSRDVERDIDAVAGDVRRVHGSDRYRTALAVTRLGAGALELRTTWFATGHNYADALTAGPAAARRASPVMLVDPDDLDRSPATRTYVREVDELLRGLVVAGGDGAVSPEVVSQLRDEAR